MKTRSSIFQLQASDGQARAGRLFLTHGEVPTPVFMPVGTRGSVKTLWQDDLEAMGAKIILANTYHLYLRPGHQLIDEVAGGLHNFISWPGNILTDSGGFQIYSLAGLRKITDQGVHFQSHIDGSAHFIGPLQAMEIQRALGADIVMAFDECPALPASSQQLRESVERTLSWLSQCVQVPLGAHQHLFGIVQGGLDLKLRLECLQRIEEFKLPGVAIGGLSVGEKNTQMQELCQEFVCQMPPERPRYLMGVGSPIDVLNGVRNGIDMFDCVLPTRNARNGQLLTAEGPINLKNEKYKRDQRPPDPYCACRVCRRYTRAYLRHLTVVGEYLAGQLISFHNLSFYFTMMAAARSAILQGSFASFYQQFCERYTQQQQSKG